MKKYIMTGLVALAMTVSSCESNFDSLNVNPNEPTPENIAPSYLISPVLVRATLDILPQAKLLRTIVCSVSFRAHHILCQ